uniref:Uncharacterized protein n=1 Tax=Arundo donax TaxID=35708 RepID=A0A0A9FN57_ARUDO
MEWPVQKLTLPFGGIPQFLSECTAPGERCFFLQPYVILTWPVRIGVHRVGNVKLRADAGVM